MMSLLIVLFMFSVLNLMNDVLVRSQGICYVVKLCYNVAGKESSRVLLCNGEKTVSKSDDDSEQHGCDVNSQAIPTDAAASSLNVSINERLLPSSLGNGLPLTDTSISRSALNDSSLLLGEAVPLPQLASEDTGQSVVAQP